VTETAGSHDEGVTRDGQDQRNRAVRHGRTPSGLRPNVLAAVVMLLIQFALGIAVNLYASLPASDHGRGLLPAFGHAVVDGPLLLSLHALLGTTIIATGAGALARSARARLAPQSWLAGLALTAIVVAWLSGVRFAGGSGNGASLAMALAAAVAILCYAIILFITPAPLAPGTRRTATTSALPSRSS
jgi:hypothetical protein